jgi:hypothetical protein
MTTTQTQWVVRCIWDTTASVPGGYIESRHSTREEAEAAKATLDRIEAARRANPRMSRAEARRVAVEHYGEPDGNQHSQGVIAETVRRLTHRRDTQYAVEAV